MSKQNLFKCKICLEMKPKIKDKNPFRVKNGYKEFYFRDENGKSWQGKSCPNCEKIRSTKKSRNRGIPSLDNSLDPKKITGRKSERSAEAFYKKLGFEVKITNGHGPDLICIKNQKSFTVEVKTIIKNSKKCFYVDKIKPHRKNDDFIAMVYRDKIFVEPMKQHLKKCNSSGFRYLTKELGSALKGLNNE